MKTFSAFAAALMLGTAACSLAADRVVTAPVAAVDAPMVAGKLQTAVFAGGCFWGLEGVFEHVKGVTAVRSGYAGGSGKTAMYEIVGTGMTGHAESVEVKYDPSKTSYGTLLRVFFSVASDPTQLNRQGPDSGTQYRSTIFPQNAGQAQLAKTYIAQLNAAKTWPGLIVTTIEPGKVFYPAEGYHQNFLDRNPDYPYIVINDLPKVAALKRLLPAVWNEKSVG